ncbi:MAG: flavodoxin family protein, partial [Desulfatiglandales bacterium]
MGEQDVNMSTVLGIYGSPRKGGNTDILLDTVLQTIEENGVDVQRVFVRNLKMTGCIECGKCDDTGICAINDQMQEV